MMTTLMFMKLVYMIVMTYFMILFSISFKLYYVKYNLYHPINQMIFLFIMILTFSIYLFVMKEDSISCMLLLITFISGILVMFSYFTALSNVPMSDFKYFVLMFLVMMGVLMVSFFILISNNNFDLFLFFNINYFNTLTINEIFMLSKVHILVFLMFMLILIMYLSMKLSLTKNYPLRSNSK